MYLFSLGVVLALAVAASTLSTWSQRAGASAAEQTVLTTALYGVAGGGLANGACAAAARAARAVAPGDEMGACAPYGLVAAAVAVKLHLYRIDGYGPDEWAYVTSTSGKTAACLRDGLDRALGLVDLDTAKLGLVKSDQDSQGPQS